MKFGVVTGVAAVVTAAAVIGSAASPGVASTRADNGRQSRTSGVAIAGGDVYLWSQHRSIHDGGGCTLNFAVRSTVTQQVGVLTAGHCVGTLDGGPTFTVHQTRNGAGNSTDPGVTLGAVYPGQVRFGRHGDSAFVGLAAGRSARPAVFTGGTATRRTIPVAGLGRLRDGIHVCYSGEASGEHCGFRVYGRPHTLRFADRRHTYRIHDEWSATRRTCTSRAGDSGSPVYVKRHGRAYAVGILSGAQRHAGRCPFYFTPVKLALSRLQLRLLIAR